MANRTTIGERGGRADTIKMEMENVMKKEIENTPPPWTVGQRFNDESGAEYISVDGGPGNRHRIAAVWCPTESKECEANARLIAAAPLLLTALRNMFSAIGPQEIGKFSVTHVPAMRVAMQQAQLAIRQTLSAEKRAQIEQWRKELGLDQRAAASRPPVVTS